MQGSISGIKNSSISLSSNRAAQSSKVLGESLSNLQPQGAHRQEGYSLVSPLLLMDVDEEQLRSRKGRAEGGSDGRGSMTEQQQEALFLSGLEVRRIGLCLATHVHLWWKVLYLSLKLFGGICFDFPDVEIMNRVAYIPACAGGQSIFLLVSAQELPALHHVDSA